MVEGDDRRESNATEAPVRKPTRREKVSVLLPAIVAFAGIVVMLGVVLGLAISRN
ncbi:hypothetical protein BH23CHL5_BH23CHL5_01660 [soil metagenome]